ncbi:TetR/AcrR family transcriptional regulator [Georgenia muralis]|nr:TetR/AcrR family transcriptional regulator [Georgenia muralis]
MPGSASPRTSGSASPRTSGSPIPRRRQILDAAAELFARSGFRGVSIDDIGAAVGISGPALYRHFPRKEAILGELLVGISEELLEEGRRRARDAGGEEMGVGEATETVGEETDVGGVAALVDWHVEFALDHPDLITVQARDLDALGPEDREHVRRLQLAYVEVWVDALRAEHPGVDVRTARAAAHAAFGLINSTPHSARLARAEMAALLRRMALQALRAVDVEPHRSASRCTLVPAGSAKEGTA